MQIEKARTQQEGSQGTIVKGYTNKEGCTIEKGRRIEEARTVHNCELNSAQ